MNAMPPRPHDVVIVGAGLSGLSLAYSLRRLGIEALVLEKEAHVAEPWRRRHPQLHLNTHRRLSSLPGYAMPTDGPAFPARDEVVSYLERYAGVTQANISFETSVEALHREGGGWVLETSSGSLKTIHVVFATGKERQPKIPDWPGREAWSGQLIHSANLGDVSQYADKNVLVVGAGNSGVDVLNHLVCVPARSLHVSIRQGSVVVPTRLLGFPVQLGSPVMDRMPSWLVDKMLAATEWITFGNLKRFGFPKRAGAASRLLREGVSPAIDHGFVAALKRGGAKIVGPVKYFEEEAVILDGEDTTRLQPDVVIAATGYSTELKRIVGKYGAVDDRGLPLVAETGEAKKAPGLWFAGMAPRLTGYFWAARRNSGAMAEALRDRLQHAENERLEQTPVASAPAILHPAE